LQFTQCFEAQLLVFFRQTSSLRQEMIVAQTQLFSQHGNPQQGVLGLDPKNNVLIKHDMFLIVRTGK
jgi:hypothetical protein